MRQHIYTHMRAHTHTLENSNIAKLIAAVHALLALKEYVYFAAEKVLTRTSTTNEICFFFPLRSIAAATAPSWGAG